MAFSFLQNIFKKKVPREEPDIAPSQEGEQGEDILKELENQPLQVEFEKAVWGN